MFRLTTQTLVESVLTSELSNVKAGALVAFGGWVRDHNEGKKVSSLEYQVYEALALKEGERIIFEAREKFNVHEVLCVHRHGHLSLGETAVWIGVTASHRDDAFKAARYVIDQIKLRLPIWKKEHYVAHEAHWVFCRDHATHVHFEASDYYAKQTKLVSQERLSRAQVLIVGAGGLGCPVLTSLTMAGVGHIDLVDFDKVSISNVHRQPLYSPAEVGELKVDIAKLKLSGLNPFIHVHAHAARIDADNVERFLAGKDLVIDCTDNLETKFVLHDACFKQRVPLVSASIYKNEGQLRTFVPGDGNGCSRCSLETTPDDTKLGNCNDFGVLGAAVGALGHLQASEAIRFLDRGTNSTASATLFMNFETLSQFKVGSKAQGGCRTCAGDAKIVGDLQSTKAALIAGDDLEVSLSQVSDDFLLVDIREQDDDFAFFAYRDQQKKIVFYCHRGLRSKRLAKDLRDAGYSNFYSLKGGACSL